MLSSAVGLGKGIVRGKMEDQVMKEAHEQVVAACNLKLPLVYRWLQCQQLFCLDHDHFQASPPTILQSCDREDECSSSYEENFDGNKDSGDTGSVGDPELVSAFDGQSGGFGSSQRHGSRGSKSRQVLERREREGW